MKTFHQSSLTFCFAVLFSMIVMVGQAYADCTNPAGTEGQQIYNTTYNAMQFCNGTNWVAMTGGVAGDNLGNHTAISDLDMGTNSITNVGGVTASGLISTTGAVIVGTQAGCAAGDAGAIRYVGGAVPYEYCDGGGTWSPFKQPACGDDDTAGCYIDTTRSNSDPDFTAANVRSGTNVLGVTGTLTPQSAACSDDSSAECTLDATRSVSDPEFLAENIKSGTTILGVTGTLISTSGGGGYLYTNPHTAADCTAAGGTVETIGSDEICNFSGSSCPGGWNSYNNLNKTASTYCSQDGCPACTAPGRSTWGTSQATCTYRYFLGRACAGTKTCTANISNVACY